MAAKSRPPIPRDWRLVAATGCAGFAVSFALFHYFAPAAPWIGLANAPATALTAVAAMGAAILINAQGLQAHNQRMRIALDNMSQGLCMFDTHKRLVVCNRRYAEMYKLPNEIVRPGTTLRALLEYRKEDGTFSRKID